MIDTIFMIYFWFMILSPKNYLRFFLVSISWPIFLKYVRFFFFKTKLEIQKALAEDSTVYEYDSIYDEMQKKKEESNPKLLLGKDRKVCSWKYTFFDFPLHFVSYCYFTMRMIWQKNFRYIKYKEPLVPDSVDFLESRKLYIKYHNQEQENYLTIL